MREGWYIFNPESNEFKKIRYSSLPKNPGHIFLRELKNKKSFNLAIFSPSGEYIKGNDYKGSILSVDKVFEEALEELKKEAHELTAQTVSLIEQHNYEVG